jgi:hypothetical protein
MVIHRRMRPLRTLSTTDWTLTLKYARKANRFFYNAVGQVKCTPEPRCRNPSASSSKTAHLCPWREHDSEMSLPLRKSPWADRRPWSRQDHLHASHPDPPIPYIWAPGVLILSCQHHIRPFMSKGVSGQVKADMLMLMAAPSMNPTGTASCNLMEPLIRLALHGTSSSRRVRGTNLSVFSQSLCRPPA